MSAKITLHEKALKSIERRHPWIFSGAINSVKGDPEDGDILKLVAPNGTFAARGYWNRQSQIRVRILTWDEDDLINSAFWEARLRQAIEARQSLGNPSNTARRLINAENDYIPGLIVDQYGEWLVLQALTLGIDRRKELFAELLATILKPTGIYERSDADIRQKEGLDEARGVLWGEEPPDTVEIEENGQRFLVDIKYGHKTGFYLDQQVNRALFRDMLTAMPNTDKMTVLNAFSYSGGFAVAAQAAGVQQVISLDSSDHALQLAEQNLALNGFKPNEGDFIRGDVFEILRDYREDGEEFDCIVLDPPKFARHSGQVERATRGYKDINLLAFQLLKPGGLLWTFSCSNAISPDLFQKVVFGALSDSGRDAQIIQRLTAAPDHPIALTFPEGEYLKGLVCRVW
jgi:23S rRNA (cytosine1962-C5)-methyltransferase